MFEIYLKYSVRIKFAITFTSELITNTNQKIYIQKSKTNRMREKYLTCTTSKVDTNIPPSADCINP